MNAMVNVLDAMLYFDALLPANKFSSILEPYLSFPDIRVELLAPKVG